MNQTILAVAVLACVAFFMTEVSVAAPYIQPKCRCTLTQSNPIRVEKIKNYMTVAAGPHCKKLQVIAIVKFKKEVEVCLNPNDQWVQDALKKVDLRKSQSTDTKVTV
ncbi:alveolar macrophage chemotactic factor-like [Salminus brasiliensis]|uniref:alveolar macrophage chemotactic factor-like n=1 Tax=Salminus brasiliensis TaxID=930266 RepID=UPI003B831254